jgi:hypothetical protein
MTLGPSIRHWLVRAVFILIPLYALWWLAGAEESVLAVIKIVMEPLLPQLFSTVQSVVHTVEGGWKITTTIHPVGDASVFVAIGIAPVFLKKCVIWIPAALALVVASAPAKPKTISLAVLITLLTAVALTAICVAAHLAVTINGMPAMLDDGILPPPPDFRLDATSYLTWYFHLVTFANYLGILIAPLAMPVLIWLLTCSREIRVMLNLTKQP